MHNFPISPHRFQRRLIRALGLIKRAAAETNRDLGLFEGALALGPAIDAIIQAAQEVADGRFDADFVVDVFQTGSGTSSNMNANEVIANRANELLGQPGGRVSRCTPTTTSTSASPPTTSSPPRSTSPR